MLTEYLVMSPQMPPTLASKDAEGTLLKPPGSAWIKTTFTPQDWPGVIVRVMSPPLGP
jgi:hypothetical protein